MFINHIKLSTVRFLVNKNQLKKQILQKELQIKKLHLHQSSTEFCNQLYNTLILEKAILKKELENLEKNCILEKIKKPFVLVLFDHHTDMQPSYFEELMSCGCWVKKTLDDNEYIEKVVLIGNKEELINSVEEKYKSKIICFSEEYIKDNYKWEEF